MSGSRWIPTGQGPIYRRLVGVHSLWVDSSIRIRSLIAVVEDLSAGVLVLPTDDRDVLALLATSMSREMREQDQLADRLREITIELGKQVRP